MSIMQYNVCRTCDAKDGRAGPLFNGECENCYQTRLTGKIKVFSYLERSEQELEKTFSIVNNLAPKNVSQPKPSKSLSKTEYEFLYNAGL